MSPLSPEATDPFVVPELQLAAVGEEPVESVAGAELADVVAVVHVPGSASPSSAPPLGPAAALLRTLFGPGTCRLIQRLRRRRRWATQRTAAVRTRARRKRTPPTSPAHSRSRSAGDRPRRPVSTATSHSSHPASPPPFPPTAPTIPIPIPRHTIHTCPYILSQHPKLF